MTIRNSLAAAIVLVMGITVPAKAASHGRGHAQGGRNHGAAARPVAVVRPTVITGRAVVRRPTVVPRTVYGRTIIGRAAIGRTVISRPLGPRRGVQRVVIAPYRSFHRPYYTFRPRVRFSFGVMIGYPVPYPYYTYAAPYPVYQTPYPVYQSYPAYPAYPPAAAYPSAPPYPAYPQGSVSAIPAPPEVGGISFEFSPADAAIYVDGQYVGTVSSFGPSSAPLSLAPGRHHVELQALNYIPLAFDVDVVAGEVIPYQGSLRPY